ncbi:DUF4214 domain-containing protein (plasmid) [Sulfitobacter faviae]|uniref:DUF4214 domain-containing protein n=2 Tax=Sulfitobacter TaxID=60136 RepID=A0ABZ0V450_9RHOB|nr:DUF4214 domain-containing protein [Sulfitobacter faviae]WPZ23645.1 DUF4214 domain-containing protein [Sulfitobacter faviae]
MATTAQINAIAALYAGYFNRAPDPEGLQFWIDQIDGGREFNTIAEDFAASEEATSLYPYLTAPDVASPSTFITNVYQNLFNRAPDAEGLQFWTDVLNSGSVSVADMIEAIIEGAVDAPDATPATFDKTTLDNKVEVGLDFAADAANTSGFDFDDADKSAATAVIDSVTNEEATVDAAKASTDAYLSGTSNQGQTYTLTTEIDALTGSTADDTFTGVAGNILNGTFNTGDSINGGTGNDTLNIIATQGGTVTPASMTGVENISVQDLSGGLNINLANATGVESVASKNSTAFTSFSNVAALVDIAVSNINNAGSSVQVNYNTNVVTGLDDVQEIALDGANTFVNVVGIETFNVAATGSNTLNLGNDGNTVNVSGDGSLTLTGALGVTTLDASANTGGVTATLATGNVAVTGGSGDDSFDFNAGLTAAATGVPGDVVDGGEGMDTVRVTTSGDLSAAAAAAPFNALTSVERVAFDGNGVTLNGSTFTNAGITNLEFSTTGADTINNAGSARTYEFGTANTGDALFNMSGTSSVLNLTMMGTDGSAAANDGMDANVGNLTVNLAGTAPAGTKATINIESQGDLADGAGGDFNNVGTVSAVAGSTINITGEGNLDLNGLANNGTIDASAATGNLVLEGSNFANGPFVSGADTITLGAGADTVQFSSGAASGVADTTPGAANTDLQVDVVNGFTAGNGGDVLDFTGVAGDSDYTALTAAVQAQIDALSGATATLQNAADIAADIATADEWTAFTFQGQTYAQYDSDGNGDFDAASDLLVQITGVSVADLNDTNFA